METKQLRYFVTVVEEGSITAAAQKLGLSQSNISRQLSKLESELDKQLFFRENRKMTLTENGKYFFSKSIEILSLLDSTERNLKGKNASKSKF